MASERGLKIARVHQQPSEHTPGPSAPLLLLPTGLIDEICRHIRETITLINILATSRALRDAVWQNNGIWRAASVVLNELPRWEILPRDIRHKILCHEPLQELLTGPALPTQACVDWQWVCCTRFFRSLVKRPRGQSWSNFFLRFLTVTGEGFFLEESKDRILPLVCKIVEITSTGKMAEHFLPRSDFWYSVGKAKLVEALLAYVPGLSQEAFVTEVAQIVPIDVRSALPMFQGHMLVWSKEESTEASSNEFVSTALRALAKRGAALVHEIPKEVVGSAFIFIEQASGDTEATYFDLQPADLANQAFGCLYPRRVPIAHAQDGGSADNIAAPSSTKLADWECTVTPCDASDPAQCHVRSNSAMQAHDAAEITFAQQMLDLLTPVDAAAETASMSH